MPEVNKNDFKIPILLGVTGHRDLALGQLEQLRELLINDIKGKVFKSYPESPVKLLSPLADGADRLVADIALSLNIPLVVPLPMPQQIYESTFIGDVGSSERDRSIQEFRQLLARAEDAFTLPMVEGITESDILCSSDARGKQFALVGAFLAKHCHILIAVYDGQDSEKVGGTAQIMNYWTTGQMAGLPLVIQHDQYEKIEFVNPDNIFDTQHIGIVWHVHVARKGAGSTPAVKIEELPKEDNAEISKAKDDYKKQKKDKPYKNRYTDALNSLNNFNRDVEDYKNNLSIDSLTTISDSEELRKKEAKIVRAEGDNAGCLQGLRCLFHAADKLAVTYSSEHKNYFAIFFAIVLSITASEVFFAKVDSIPALWTYFSLLTIGFVIHRQHKKKEVHSRYNEYRALAEALRVQFFWRCAGLRSIVPDHYLRKHQQDAIWISCALKALTLKCYSGAGCAIEFVMEAWVKNQKEWYDGKRNSIKEENHYTKVLISALYGSMFVLSLIGVTLEHMSKEIHTFLSVTLGVLPVIFLLLEHKMNYLADAERKRSYDIYHHLFDRAYNRYETAVRESETKHDEARQIIYQVGCEALIENGDWLIVNRDKKVEAPKG